MLRFEPEIKLLGNVQGQRTIAELAEETSVYAASPQFVKENCGPIANEILNSVDPAYFDECKTHGLLPNIDVRVHRLNAGEYPAVPGWHCDGELRETYFAQPDMDRYRVRNTVLCTVSSASEGVSNTEIAAEGLSVDLNEEDFRASDFVLWREVHKRVSPSTKTMSMQDGEITQISCKTLHRCKPAKVRGWRLFFRMSMWHNDYLGEQGKIADQQQVYILSEGNGW